MKNYLIQILGWLLDKIAKIYHSYLRMRMINSFGEAGTKVNIGYPFYVTNPGNIFLEDGVNIGAGATLMSKYARILIGKNSFSGPNLTIITGDHMFVPNRYMIHSYKSELKAEMDICKYDKDVIIEQDVWIGANVIILKGVTVGRCAILASGSMVIKNVPPYSIVGGNPAKVLKFKWNVNDILTHEEFLFADSSQRMTRDEIENLLSSSIG